MASMYEFPNEISCHRAISWSPDNRICICTDTATKILSLNCGTDNADSKVRCHQSSFPVNADIFDIPQFTKQEHKYLLKNLSREDIKALTVERVLNPWKYQVESVPRTGYVLTDWSPPGADDIGRSILATLSQDYRLCLYTHNPSQNQWSLVCDLSMLRRTQTKPVLVLDSIDAYIKYKDWCFSQAVTVMKWCHSVFTDSSSCQKYMMLATGTKSGDVAIWRVNAPCHSQCDCSILYTVQPHQCQISGLNWSQQSDLLTMGYTDGQIQAVHVNTEDVKKEPSCTCVYGEQDLMRVSCMCILENIKTDVYVLLANKEQCIIALQLDRVNHTVISQSHIFLENVLPASGMCAVANDTVIMMSQDAILQKILVRVDNNDINLSSEIVKLDLCGEVTLISHGFCLSPNRMFSAFITRPRPGFDHLVAKIRHTATKIHIRCLDDFNVGTNCLKECASKLCQSTGAVVGMLDVLDLYRQSAVDRDYTLVDSKDEDGKVSCVKLKLRRYGLMIRLKSFTQKEAGDEFGQDFEKEIDDLFHAIVAMYIKTSVMNITAENVASEQNTGSLEVVHAMYIWLVANAECLSEVQGINGTKQQLEEIINNRNTKCRISCCVCSNILTWRKQQWQCGNGHSFDVCSKTLLPVEGVDYQTCTICHSYARPEALFKGISWLSQESGRCTLCDGLMLSC